MNRSLPGEVRWKESCKQSSKLLWEGEPHTLLKQMERVGPLRGREVIGVAHAPDGQEGKYNKKTR